MACHGHARGGQRVLISSGGIASLTLAYWLHHHGWQPTIVEQASHLRTEGHAIDFAGSGWDVAEWMQFLPALRQRQTSVDFFLFKDSTGRTVARLPTAVFWRAFHDKMIQTTRPDLAMVLYAALDSAVPLRFGTSIQQLDQASDCVGVTFTDGTRRHTTSSSVPMGCTGTSGSASAALHTNSPGTSPTISQRSRCRTWTTVHPHGRGDG